MASKNDDMKAATLARIQRTEVYAEGVRRAFAKTVNAILALNKSMPTLDDGEMFSFDAQRESYQKKVEALLRQLHSVVTTAIKRGIVLEWDKANDECDKLVQSVFGKEVLSSTKFTAWTDRNESAMDSFINRSDKGLNLSDRIWQNVQQLRDEMEVAMTVAIGEGNSAASMSRKVRQYLNDPDLMFRRFRYKDPDTGEWKRKWKKRIKDETTGKYRWIDYDKDSYKVGAGVYKSSAQNAMRVTRTETNIAYRRADHERWSQMDFVLGQRVNLSRNHPKKDICDKLAGDYPKDFIFDGWHPQCFCYVTPITLNPDETSHLTKMMLNGEDWRKELKRLVRGREIKSYPDNFKEWVNDNANKIAASQARGTEPYFIKNNAKAINKILNPDQAPSTADIAAKRHEERSPEKEKELREYWNKKVAEGEERRKKQSILDKAAARHAARTPEQIADIQQRAAERQKKHALIKKTANNVLKVANEYAEVDFSDLEKYINEGNLDAMFAEYKNVAKRVSEMKKKENSISDLIPNAHSLHKSYSINELEEAYKELDGVMKKWLSKYSYSSIDNAPLEHLRNKLDFELTNPTISYSQKDIINKAINEKIRVINQKIQWNDLVSKAASLKTFKTKSTIYKNCLIKIDDAIKSNDFTALQKSIEDAENQQQKLIDKQIKRGGDIKSALNKEYKGGAIGKDISSSIDVDKMTSEDPYRGTFTNNVARMQGFDAPAKLVSEAEFAILEKACGDVFYRTVNPTTFKGKKMSSAEFASQLYVADLLELNGPGGRVYGDGMYVATSAWDGSRVHPLTDSRKNNAYHSSVCYGNGNHTLSEMTWTRKPKIIKQSDLFRMWNKLSLKQQEAFGDNENTYACALGYDAMFCDGPDYMVIWNRSIIAVKKK